jgi:hypothetical protein
VAGSEFSCCTSFTGFYSAGTPGIISTNVVPPVPGMISYSLKYLPDISGSAGDGPVKACAVYALFESIDATDSRVSENIDSLIAP